MTGGLVWWLAPDGALRAPPRASRVWVTGGVTALALGLWLLSILAAFLVTPTAFAVLLAGDRRVGRGAAVLAVGADPGAARRPAADARRPSADRAPACREAIVAGPAARGQSPSSRRTQPRVVPPTPPHRRPGSTFVTPQPAAAAAAEPRRPRPQRPWQLGDRGATFTAARRLGGRRSLCSPARKLGHAAAPPRFIRRRRKLRQSSPFHSSGSAAPGAKYFQVPLAAAPGLDHFGREDVDEQLGEAAAFRDRSRGGRRARPRRSWGRGRASGTGRSRRRRRRAGRRGASRSSGRRGTSRRCGRGCSA